MEELLNKLMKRGWKVYWEYDKLMSNWQTRWKRDFWFWVLWEVKYSLRELVSKESWLWQFVCENGLLDVNKKYEWEYWTQSYKLNWEEYTHEFSRWCENYRIIESALKDEDELEKFLLENIKIS